MTITVKRDPTGAMRHIVHVGEHTVAADLDIADGGEASGIGPHDFYDTALGTCKALTALWYAKRKGIPVTDIEVTIERDNSQERAGVYRLATGLKFGGDLTDAQRNELLSVAAKCPVHKLMTTVTTEITTTLAE